MIEKSDKKTNVIYYALLIVATLLLGYLSLGSGFDFNVFPAFTSDKMFGMVLTKNLQENGLLGTYVNYRLGAPEHSSFIDYPVLGSSMILILWALSWFIKSTPAIMYVYLILTFAIDGISMSWLLRKLNIRMNIAFVVSVLFSIAPFHFYRYLAHSSLIDYSTIPMAIYLCLLILNVVEEEKIWKKVLLCVLIGIGYGYFYAFALILMAVAYLVKFIKLDKKKEIIRDIWMMPVILLTVFLQMIPKIIYSFKYGKNEIVGVRSWTQQEIAGLKISNLLMPVNYSRIDALREINEEYCRRITTNESTWAPLGFIGSAGFLILCGCLIYSFVNKKAENSKEWEIINFSSLATLCCILFGSPAGFGEIFNWAITSQIRCYNRMSIVVMAFALICIAVFLNRNFEKTGKIKPWVILGCMIGVGIFDQYKVCEKDWQQDLRDYQNMFDSYFSEVEDSFPEGACVYQIPFVVFPESGLVNNLSNYQHMLGYMFTDNMRWSYGGVKGRNEVAKDLFIDNGMSFDFIELIKKNGFDAVYIDIDAYADYGEEVLAFYDELNLNSIACENGKLFVYDIRDFDRRDLTNSYMYVSRWARYNNKTVSRDECKALAEGLENKSKDSVFVIYSWYADNETFINYSDEEYVTFLYNTFLNRKPDTKGMNTWLDRLSNGLSREDAFTSAITSNEFRKRLFPEDNDQ